ncbi:2'-5' RNA ligase [Murinocardiopsis flavida]|uniref:RNA 2',3'-cyclic phosphodiesterase n=1 Tax=Murinocardiopsis flavida TaxID=645275 RepID=A0A2P8DR41_9ACTN|nr:RNA 2',3'-cyclic phosphodiesterase [Murinocardiopsis flavida]PSK99680.1 2'-5' RNA ligase [Murinocardiopsis flavida]
MRLFAALFPPDPVRDRIGAATAPLRARRPGLTWAQPHKWHLTLLFLGEVPDPAVAAVREGLAAEAARHRPLRLGLRGTGSFPADPGRARVLWADVTGDTAALHALADGLRSAVRAAGVPVEDRAYTPHLTLARSTSTTDLTALHEDLAGFATAEWTADRVELVHSRLGAPRYATVATWHLT